MIVSSPIAGDDNRKTTPSRLFLLRLAPAAARWLALLAFGWFCLVFGASAPARAQELILQPDAPYRQAAPFVRYIEDAERSLSLDDAIAANRAGRFKPLANGAIDFGFTDARIWLEIPVRNQAREQRRSVLALNVNYMYELDAWLVTDNGPTRLFRLTEESPFAARPTQDLHLAAPFTLGPQEAGVIYIAYWSAGATAMPVAIETPVTFAERRTTTEAWHAASYSVLGVFVVFSILIWTIVRSPLFVLYALYIASTLLFIMHADGATFRFLWPGWPHWNAFASLPLALAINITAGLFTRVFLNTAKAYPRIDKAFLAVIAVSALMIVAGLAFEREARILAFPLVLLAALTYLMGGVRALRDGAPGALYYVIGWTAISVAALIASVVNTPFSTNYITFDLVRASMVFDGLMMALALMVRVALLRAERDELVGRELAVMRSNMDMVDRINALEQRHALAESVAAARGRTLTSAFHDMHQPLLSLRLAAQRLAREPAAADDAAQLEASLSYLEELAETLLADSLMRGPAGENVDNRKDQNSVETFNAQLVLDALEQMFARDARDKGLRFACVSTKAALRAQPIVLLRILSNLTANAVKHTSAGGVVIGCRKRDERIWLCVYDTGQGLSREKLEGAAEPRNGGAVRGAASGFGLGLSIVARLAAEHGFLIESRSMPGVGTFFAVGVLPSS